MNSRKFFTRRKLIISGLCVAVIAVGMYLWPKIFKGAPKKLYAVMVVVRSQEAGDPAEDARSSLKAGDVLAVQEESHVWSQTELVSYLILKMNLTEEQATKLTAPKERELKESELSEAEKKRIEDEKSRAAVDGREYRPEPQRETLLARAYRVNLDEIGFTDANALFNGQPYIDKMFGWEIVEKK